MENFVRLMPKQGFQEWPSLMREIADLCKETEYKLVKEGYRKAATLHIQDENYEELTEKINKDGLIYTPILKAGYSEGFSHEHKEVKEGEPYYWYGCLTKNYEDGQEFKNADGSAQRKKPNHKKIGKLLGYPDCCVNYFDKNFNKNWDPVWIDKSGKVKGYPECNRILRYFGVQITWHFSCSPTCEKTREEGEKWFSVMKGINKDLAEKTYKLLSEDMIWDSYHGVVQIETPYFVGLSHTFPYIEKKRIINWQVKNK
jgi:hypothetical protein